MSLYFQSINLTKYNSISHNPEITYIYIYN